MNRVRKQAGDDGRAPLTGCRPNASFPSQNGVENESGDEVACGRKQERRERLDADGDTKIGRSPDDIDGSKSGDKQDGVTFSSVVRRSGRGCFG